MTPETENGQGPAIAEQAQEKVQEGAQAAREQAENVAQQARDQARQQVDQRTTDAGDRLKGHAGDARSMAEHLRSEGKDAPARMIEQAADRAEGLGGYLTEADADRLVHDVEAYARRNPWAVIAGGLVVGFAASRVLGASSATRSSTTVGQPRPRQGLPVPAPAPQSVPPLMPETAVAHPPATGAAREEPLSTRTGLTGAPR